MRDFAPGDVNEMVQVPAATAAVHVSVPSVTVTLPVGVPAPGAIGATVYRMVIVSPTMDGSGVSEVIVVDVLAALTVWGLVEDVLPPNTPSPAYVAAKLPVFAAVNVMVHDPAATVPVQLSVPSLTVTFPVGVPVAGGTTLTA